jgi:hypothetical protein
MDEVHANEVPRNGECAWGVEIAGKLAGSSHEPASYYVIGKNSPLVIFSRPYYDRQRRPPQKAWFLRLLSRAIFARPYTIGGAWAVFCGLLSTNSLVRQVVRSSPERFFAQRLRASFRRRDFCCSCSMDRESVNKP